jgi:hypothetical protein
VRGAAASRAQDAVELGARRSSRWRADDLVHARVGQGQDLGAPDEVEDVRRARLRAQLLEHVDRLVDDEDVAVRRDALGERCRIVRPDRDDGGQRRKKVKSR